VAVAPRSAPWIDAAVTSAGGSLVEPAEATALVWTAPAQPDALAAALDAAPAVEWVQLPWAGVEPYVDLIRAHRHLVWTCAKGVYADPVAEHALALLLAGFRHLGAYARAETWGRGEGRNLFGAKVTILGGGGIARVLVALLAPFRCEVTVVRRSSDARATGTVGAVGAPGAVGEGGDGAAVGGGSVRVVSVDRLHDALVGAEALVLALPLVPETRGIVGADELALLAPGAWVVNMARGEHVDTDALVAALDSGRLGGAGLDVTDPEPLPDGHPLWGRSDVIITPHTGNTPEMAKPLLSARVSANVSAYADGGALTGLVDPDLGY
jgi:phosphoglycerate dehydrogenase-like enzyme